MVSFNLNTTFTSDDLKRLASNGANVVVAKPNNGGTPNVNWVVFKPLISNSMSWEENYGIYASNQDLISGGVLEQMSQTPYPAVPAALYTMQPYGAFTGPGGAEAAGSYYALNSYNNLPKGYLTIGLFQNAEVNNNSVTGNAVSATQVLYNSTAQITPYTSVYLWTQSNVKSNSVVTTVSSPQTQVTFGGSVTSVSLDYDPLTGTFIPALSTTLADGIALEYHQPAL